MYIHVCVHVYTRDSNLIGMVLGRYSIIYSTAMLSAGSIDTMTFTLLTLDEPCITNIQQHMHQTPTTCVSEHVPICSSKHTLPVSL